MIRRTLALAVVVALCVPILAQSIVVRRGAAGPPPVDASAVDHWVSWDDDTSGVYTMGASDCSEFDTESSVIPTFALPDSVSANCWGGAGNCIRADATLDAHNFTGFPATWDNEGCMGTAFYVHTWQDAHALVSATNGTTHAIFLALDGTDELTAEYNLSGGAAEASVTTTDCDLATETIYYATVCWISPDNTGQIAITAWNAAGSQVCTASTSSGTYGGFSPTSFWVGCAGTTCGDVTLDQSITTQDWDADFTEFFDETDAPASACPD